MILTYILLRNIAYQRVVQKYAFQISLRIFKKLRVTLYNKQLHLEGDLHSGVKTQINEKRARFWPITISINKF